MMLATRGVEEVGSGPSSKDHIAAGGVIGSHVLQHAYGHAFYVILTAMYSTLGLTPVMAGLLGSVRSIGSGVASTAGGFLIDRLQHRRLLILYVSMATMGLGYLLVGLAPTYILILIAFAFTAGAASIWHPASRSLLSQIYPHRRGFMLSMDRSAGNVGDTIGPLIAGALLVWMAWQHIFMAAFPLALAFVLFLWLVLRRANTFQELGARKPAESRPFLEQFRSLFGLMRASGKILILLLLVKGVAGFGQGGLMLWVPLYLQEAHAMGPVAIGSHVALLTGVGIVTGPAFGYLSDRTGRVPVIMLVLGGKATIAALLALMGSGVMLTLLIAAMGAFMFGVNSLIQAWALDIAQGRRLEGSIMGVMYGTNMFFHGLAPLLIGLVVAGLGFSMLFWYVAGMNAAGVLLVALALPMMAQAAKAVRPNGAGEREAGS